MSRSEFEQWIERFNRAPWGSAIDDRRHAQICLLLQGLMNMWASRAARADVDEFLVDKTKEVHAEIKNLLYSNLKAPWLNGKTPEELAVEGQLMFKAFEDRYGRTKN